jgi:hypothetical protein
MNGITTLIFAAVANSIALGVVVFAVKKIVNTAINGLGRRLDTEREDRIKEDDEIWGAINKHGHKGLDVDGSKVTR